MPPPHPAASPPPPKKNCGRFEAAIFAPSYAPSHAAAPSHEELRFHGFRLRESGCYSADITQAEERMWLGTFNMLEEAART
jgi:hypothetical protein